MPEIYSHTAKIDHTKSSHKKPPEEELKRSPGHTRNPLASYCYYPHSVNFMNKDKEELIVLLVRKHPITNLPWVFVALLMLLAPVALTIIPLFGFLPATFQTMGLLFWYLLTLAFIFEQFLSWYFNVNIVTDERVFDVDFNNLLYREITDAQISQIQDVTVKVGSAIRTILNYGDVHIQTAGEVPEIEFQAVPNPDRIAKILRDLQVEEQTEQIEGRVR
jgi:hypothetical protein